MAKIVLGLATSHSPMLSAPAAEWVSSFGAKDRYDPVLGQYEELHRRNAARLAGETNIASCQERHRRTQEAIGRVATTLQRVAPDTVVIIGDDHHEMFSEDHMPAVNVYWGEKYFNAPVDLRKVPAFRRSAMWAYYPEKPEWYPCDAELGRHVIECLIAQQFDVSHSRTVPADGEIGHAFNFIVRRFMPAGRPIPQVPIFLNTYFPPTQPAAGRCYALGKALRRAIENWDAKKTVAIVASGGLSHIALDEEFDRSMLAAMERKDEAAICCWPESKFQAGTSEAKTWIVLAGAMEETAFPMRLIDYVPCYRSLAGTGVGAAFAEWV